jgi:hypothetical protein
MSDRKDVTFSMSWEDLSFLSYALGFISGGIKDKDETIRGYWQVTFERALKDNFEENGEPKRAAGKPLGIANGS